MPKRKGDPGYWLTRAQASWSNDIRLPREDRLESASEMRRRDVRSWSQLSDKELEAFCYVARAVHLIDELRRQRGQREAS